MPPLYMLIQIMPRNFKAIIKISNKQKNFTNGVKHCVHKDKENKILMNK